MQIAITRGVSAGIGACELTHLEREAIDVARARMQHRAYEEALARAGCRVESLPALDELPDSVFVEDVAVVLDDIAIITRPGAESRRPEAAHIAPVLAQHRRVTFIKAPGTLDGGDVLRLGRRIFVGRSGRSDESGVEQLRAVVWPYGYTVTAVPVSGCLHLKSAITEAAPGVVLVNPAWVDAAAFGDVRVIEIDPDEPYAANGLMAGGRLIYPVSFPRTRQRLEAAGIAIEPVDVSELQKAEGAVTCCSLVFPRD
ncbi:MAG TPA: arginine deiminase family protein [Vicinamibacterales bacterium]|nr:arginine deiminase family protein [Vicinamibacterales bacterium]